MSETVNKLPDNRFKLPYAEIRLLNCPDNFKSNTATAIKFGYFSSSKFSVDDEITNRKKRPNKGTIRLKQFKESYLDHH